MKSQEMKNMKFLMQYLRTQKTSVLLLSLSLVVGIGLQLINPQITRYFIDEATKGATVNNLIIAALMFIAVAFVGQLVKLVSIYLGENVAWRATNDMRIDLIKHCINLDMTFHKKHKPGELIERIDGDVSTLFALFSRILLNIVNNFLLLVGILIVLLREDWRISLGFSIFAVMAIYLLWHVKSKTLNHWTKASEMNAEFYGFIGEQISSTEDIASSGAKNHVIDNFYRVSRKMFPIVKKAELTWASMWSVTFLIFAVGNVMAFALSAYLWKEGIVSVGTVYLIFNYLELLRRPIEEIRYNLQELQMSGASLVRVKELFDIKSKIKEGTSTASLSTPLTLELKNISFQYEEKTQVLHNISLNLKEGRILGILGRTGSGKTTLARLLVRLYDTNDGEILLNNKRITDISSDELREKIAYVTQNVQLFGGTLRDNITMFSNQIDDDTILKIIDELELVDWYEKLPNGLDTMIGAEGRSLSSGEGQLIAFIRVFLKDPGLIILDEATSRIDPITEQLIERALNKLLENKTCIIIAHRLWTLERADDILVIENGSVVEHGEREKLMEDVKSKYYSLLQHGIEEVLA